MSSRLRGALCSVAEAGRGAWAELRGVFGYLAHKDSLLAVSVLALLLGALEWAGRFPGRLPLAALVAGRLLWAGYFYLVARKACLGSRRLPVLTDFTDTWDALILPLLRALLAVLPLLATLALYIQLGRGWSAFLELHETRPLALLLDGGALGLLVLLPGLLLLPTMLVGALCGGGLLRLLNPIAALALVARRPQAYLRTFALVNLLGVLMAGTVDLGQMLKAALPIPVASAVLAHFLALWFPLAQARLLGGFARRLSDPQRW